MKKFKFTISERVKGLIPLLNSFKGNLDTLSSIMDDVKKIRVTDEEWTKAEMKQTTGKNEKGEDVTQLEWNDDKGGEKEIELEKETVRFLLETIEKKDKDGEITLNDIVLVSLRNKLK